MCALWITDANSVSSASSVVVYVEHYNLFNCHLLHARLGWRLGELELLIVLEGIDREQKNKFSSCSWTWGSGGVSISRENRTHRCLFPILRCRLLQPDRHGTITALVDCHTSYFVALVFPSQGIEGRSCGEKATGCIRTICDAFVQNMKHETPRPEIHINLVSS